jgi:hypothetical protein
LFLGRWCRKKKKKGMRMRVGGSKAVKRMRYESARASIARVLETEKGRGMAGILKLERRAGASE